MKYNNFIIEEITSPYFRAYIPGENIVIVFIAEWKNGLYFNIKSIHKKNRCYTAQRYFYKYMPIIRECSYIVLKNDYLWDYTNHRPALDSYNNR